MASIEGVSTTGPQDTVVVDLRQGGDDVRLMAELASATPDRAMSTLYHRYSRPIAAFARRRLGDPMAAEEVVQETLVRLWRMADRFDPARGSVDCLAFTIASRVVTDLLRRRQRTLPVIDTDTTPDAAAEAVDASACVDLRDALAALSGDHRAVLELGYFRGYTQREIAQELGVALGTVKTRTYWALRYLHDMLHQPDLLHAA